MTMDPNRPTPCDLLGANRHGLSSKPVYRVGGCLKVTCKAPYADELQAGVTAKRNVYAAMAHRFFAMASVVKQAADAQELRGHVRRESFGNRADQR